MPLDDYLIDGPQRALEVIQDITGAEQVNIVGLCVGGTLTRCSSPTSPRAATTACARRRSSTRSSTSASRASSAAFTDQASRRSLERKMAGRGYLEAGDMARTFTLLRANDLVWNYVGSTG